MPSPHRPEPPAPAGPGDPGDPGDSSPSPRLGRTVAFAFLALFLMVAGGVIWVWQRSSREQRWRERVTAAEPFTVPPPSSPSR